MVVGEVGKGGCGLDVTKMRELGVGGVWHEAG